MDCFEGIQKVPDESVDVIIADPPYFQGMTHNGKRGEFEDLAISKPFFKELFKQYKRVLKKDGSVYFFTDWRGYAFYYPLMMEALPVKNLLVWNKNSGPGNYYGFFHELIIYAKQTPRNGGRGLGGNVINIQGFSLGAKKKDGEKIHPTQKPTELIEKLILDSTEKGELVLDTFMGSGTTAVAAIRTGRNFIGFEISEEYYQKAMKRIEAERSKGNENAF
ncbi:MAG: site-specific DNA-methyltransferase [Eubacteriales bacterium]|nr:site-specific DNA-methyltransferase [Eubacteriales bacterium]